MFNGTELGYKRKSLVNIASTLCVCGAFLVLSQGKVNAAVQNTTNEEDSTENVSNSISEYNINAQSVALSDASSVTSESSSDNDAVSQETVVASSTAVIGDTNNDASSESAAAVSDVNENSATSDVDSTSTEYTSDSNIVNVIDLGAIDSVNDVEAAKAAAEQVYEETGQAQTITASMVSSYSYTDAFLDSIKAGAIQGWVNYRILPSVTAAQAICESAWGRSDLATSAHNLFGIKGSYNGNSVTYPTAEWGSGGYYTINAAFRAYSSNSESVADHGNFLVSNSRYANLVNNRNYVSVANNLQADGYATSPTYASTLIGIVQQYKLTSWDTEAFAITDTVNAGSLDVAQLTGDSLHLAGWHVATDSKGKGNSFIIILDASTNQEIARYKVSETTRPDMGSAFSNVYNSNNSGFDLTIPFSDQLAGKNLTIIHRYTSTEYGNSDFVDYNFAVNFNKNDASLDKFDVNQDGQLVISGWHAADASKKYNNHFIILLDETTGKEISRYKIATTQRVDVASAYSNTYNSLNSGFKVAADYSQEIAGHTLKVISRYSSSLDGNKDYIDYTFDEKTFDENEASLDKFAISGENLIISGWHASNKNVGLNYHSVIIYDTTKNIAIATFNVPTSERNDVANSYNNIYNSKSSGFNISTKLTKNMIGDEIRVVSRYSSEPDGHGKVNDYWFDSKRFTSDEGSLDSFKIEGKKLIVTGWNANDYSAGLDNHFIIIFDATNNKEITRINANSTIRTDVGDTYGWIYNANKSGFTVSMDLTADMVGVQLKVVSRYSDSIIGQGTNADHWFEGTIFNKNDGQLDYVVEDGDEIQIGGWHVSDESVDKPYNTVIIWDATTHREISRFKSTIRQRYDVFAFLPNSYNSLNSGYSIAISKLIIPTNHDLQIVNRYSSEPNGQGKFTDIWSNIFKL